ncbi:FAD-binding domain-containing protein [Phaeobacter sp.]|uniref:FAD-binding domain-containing protein n=1 Tax=Phaeobacter sp. TaxID=1902409 RepID=UPI0025FAB3A3|nr:FAD-binding domain-containing protein [Phaeobacter sp.]
MTGMGHAAVQVEFQPDRAAGLQKLDRFLPNTGLRYAKLRNFDRASGPSASVSALSPWIRHRLLSEQEVLQAVLERHTLRDAEKFVSEVFWRGYFKGWLQHRPSVWARYQQQLPDLLDNAASRQDYSDAVAGRTGIDCFDHWARELVETGYLHNHARMWFASIWMFTLRLPWQLGADFFLRHLMDGDPASNTLSWRWVGGLHTQGKTYLARADNIAKFTDGRFDPEGQLADEAPALAEGVIHPREQLAAPRFEPPQADYLLLLTEEDLTFGDDLPRGPAASAVLGGADGRSPRAIGDKADAFRQGALRDGVEKSGISADRLLHETANADLAHKVVSLAQKEGLTHVVTGYAPVGPTADKLAALGKILAQEGIQLHQLHRSYDALVWPNASKGFFGLKKVIPSVLRELNMPV